ncbi:MAG: hypothetical protein MRERC_1c036 [Mycoplasmataceae bacterium RC_NB112A]|nr:MAG: hypothetical protein MRERC_10c021 [Mycoplasmataceae bacterium RC_NB112A]KLL01956.1 MAG: hypothetical protein MRERC_6c045 [Mycoplasmataceae bacterium RC_NB112A]KLL02454.1 MAG: hypothetical protein MRERC_1c036 [Mycoplasmataceae bacterium RC_NB112A]
MLNRWKRKRDLIKKARKEVVKNFVQKDKVKSKRGKHSSKDNRVKV